MAADNSKVGRKKKSAKALAKSYEGKSYSDDRKGGEDLDDGDGYLPPKMTKRILEQAREQRDEMEEEEGGGGVAISSTGGLAKDQVRFAADVLQ